MKNKEYYNSNFNKPNNKLKGNIFLITKFIIICLIKIYKFTREHRQELENFKSQLQREMDDAKKQSNKDIEDLNHRLGSKIENLSKENRRDYKELDNVNIELRELTALAQRLERELKKYYFISLLFIYFRESAASDAAGTSSIQWARAEKIESNEFGRSQAFGLEERITALRETLVNVGKDFFFYFIIDCINR